MDFFERFFGAIAVAYFLAYLVFIIGVVVVGLHFLAKVW